MAGTLSSLAYIDPWGIVIPGTFQTGVIVKTGGSPPAGTVVAACLVDAGNNVLVSAAGSTSALVRLLPPTPLSTEMPYQVWIQWLPSGQTPGWPVSGMLTAALVVSIPTLTSVQITGTPPNTTVSAAWAFGAGAGGNAGAILQIFSNVEQPVLQGWFQTAGGSGSGTINLAAGVGYTAYVQAVQPAQAQPQGGFSAPFSSGPYSAPIPVTVDAPAITAVNFDGTSLSVTWNPVSLPASPLPVDVQYTLYLLDGSTAMAQWPATASGAVARTGVDLRALGSPAVAGAVSFGPVQGPPGVPVPLVIAAPAITGATVATGGGSVTVTVAAPPGLPNNVAVTVELLANGVVLTQGTASGQPLTATLDQTLAGGSAYALTAYATVSAQNGTPPVNGPPCPPVPLVAGPVQQVAASYDGQNLSLSWTPLADPALTGYQVTVTIGGGTPTAVSTPETGLVVPMQLTPGATVAVAVTPMAGATFGQPGGSTTLTVPAPTTPSIVQTGFDGSTVAVAWTPSTGPGLTGYLVVLTGTAEGEDPLTASYSAGLVSSLAFPLPASDTACTWTVTVAPVVGSWAGTASAAATLFTATPVIGQTTVTGTTQGGMTASAAWSLSGSNATLLAAMQTAGAVLQCLVLDQGQPVASQSATLSGSSGTVSISLPAGATALAARVVSSAASGPPGGAAPLLASQPGVTAAAYDGSWLALSWSGVAEGTTGHAVTLTPSSGTAITLAAGAEPSLLVPATLSLGATWAVTVQPFGQGAAGPVSASAAVTLPALATPSITLTGYNQGIVTAAWTAAAPSATYLVTVYRSGSAVVAQETAELNASIPVVLSPGRSYTVTVQPWLGRVAGTASTAAALLVLAPAVPTATTDPVAGTTTVGWGTYSGATGYLLRLGAGGGSAGTDVSVSGTSTAVSVSPGAPLSASVAAVSTTGSLSSISPYSVPFALPTDAPVLTSAAWDGATLDVAWTPVASASGYTVTVLQSGASAAFGTASATAAATGAAFALTFSDTSASYTVVVQAVFGNSTGPVSAALPVVLAQPTLGNAVFNGQTLGIPVTLPEGSPVPTGYDLNLILDAGIVQSVTNSSLADDGTLWVPLTTPVNPAGLYFAIVRARIGASAGPYVSADVILVPPQLLSAATATGGATVTVTADAGNVPAAGQTGMATQAVLYTDGTAGTAVAMPNGSAQLTLTGGTTYAVAVQAVSDQATGPLSSPAAVLTTAPSSLTARYAGGQLAAAWSGDAGGGYQLSVATGSTGVAESAVSGTSGTLAFAATPGTAYTLSVMQVAGVATGPAASLPLVTDGCTITSVTVAANRTASVQWQAPANPSAIDHVQPVIAWGGASVALAAVASSSNPLTLTLPAWAPNGAALTLQAIAGGATGPGGSAAPLLTTSPTGLQIAFADDSIQASWSAAPGGETDGYAVTLDVAGGSSTTTRVAGLSASIDYTPADDAFATVSVAATSGAGTGPGSAAPPVITAGPTLGATSFDGRTLSIAVTAPAGSTPTGYDVVLLRDGEAVQSATALAVSDHAVSLPVEIAIDPAGAYSIAVAAVAGASTGPAATAAVLLAAPLVLGVATSSEGTTLTVTAGPGPIPGTGVTMQAVLYTDGTAGTAVAMPNGSAQLTLTGGTAYAVAVRALGGDATGPWSAPVGAIATAPASLAARYANGTLSATWSGSAGGTYQLSVAAGSTGVAETTVAGTSGEVAFTATPGAAYTLSVQQVAGVATGPAASLPLVTDGCTITSAAVAANRTAYVQWQAPANPSSIDQVQPVLSWGGASAVLAAQPASTSPLTIPLPATLPNGAALTLQAIAGGAAGPGGSAVPLLTLAPAGLQLSFADDGIQAWWSPAAGMELDGYEVTLAVTGTTPSTTRTRVSGPAATLSYTPADGDAATVSVAAASGEATGPAGSAVPVITASPAITQAVYDGTSLALGWTAAADASATATLVSLLTGGVATEQATMGGTGGSIALPPGAWTARVQGAGAGTVGPPGADVTLLTAPPPLFSSVAWDALGTGCTVQWTVQTGAGAYEVLVTDGGSLATSFTVAPADEEEEMSLAIPASTFGAEGSYTLSMRTRDAEENPVAVGPWGPSTALTGAAPNGVSVAYNGVTAAVSWNAVASPIVTGYQLSSVAGETVTTLGQTTGTSASFTLTVESGSPPSIVVQALCGPAVGPPSAQAPVLAQGLFLSTGSGTTPSLAAGTAPDAPATELVLYLPQLFTTAPDEGDLFNQAPFTLAAASAPFAYTLTIGSPAWSFDAASRQTVQTAYTALLATLATQTATALGLRTVQDAVSRAMPQTFTETLYYAYGMSPADGWIDLRPGMVLRAEYEAYQVPGTRMPDGAFVSGFVATGTAEYEIASYLGGSGQWLTGFDAFLATLAAAQGISVPAMPPDSSGRAQGAGGLIDAFFLQFQQSFCRIVYPPATLGQSSTGSPYPYQNPVLLAAGSLANLDTAAGNVRDGQAPGGSVASFYFRGRTTLTACVRVLVNGAPVLVPVGTTAGNLLASLAARPPVAGLPLQGVALLRPFGAAVLSAGEGNGYPVGAGWNVRLDWSPGGSYGPSSDWLDLPLLHGDQLTFGGP